MRLLPVLFLVVTLVIAAPAIAQPRDEAPEATPAGPATSSAAEELTSKTTEQPPAEEKSAAEEEKKPVKKPEPEKKKKPAPKPEKKPAKKSEPVKKEEPKKEEPAEKKPEAKKPAPVEMTGKDPVIVINPCTGDVSEEASAPEAKTLSIQPGKQKSCLTKRQCEALCRVGEAFGEGGGEPYLSPRGYIVFGMEAFSSTDACVEACGPKCK